MSQQDEFDHTFDDHYERDLIHEPDKREISDDELWLWYLEHSLDSSRDNRLSRATCSAPPFFTEGLPDRLERRDKATGLYNAKGANKSYGHIPELAVLQTKGNQRVYKKDGLSVLGRKLRLNEVRASMYLETTWREEGFVKNFMLGTDDMLRNYLELRSLKPDERWGHNVVDKYFHCRANFEATERGLGGWAAGTIISVGREITDVYRKNDKLAELGHAYDDMTANLKGQKRAIKGAITGYRTSDACYEYGPRGFK